MSSSDSDADAADDPSPEDGESEPAGTEILRTARAALWAMLSADGSSSDPSDSDE